MVTFMIKYFIIQRMKEEGASHLPAPPAGCFGLDDGPIPTAPPKTGSLQVANSAAKTGSLQPTQFRQRMLIRRSQHSFGRESQFRC